MYERVAVEEEQRFVWVELVNAVHGYDGVSRSLATEWYTLNNVVAVVVGLGLQGQHTGRNGRDHSVAAHTAVMLVVGSAVARIVEELCAQTLVKGPVGLQILLVPHKQVVVVLQNIVFA